ncbi:MAG TPA: hypothetical protein VKD72_28930 [Gemmataceae bacterium]|nr:hypothetical protein [Gemmataceae bacterium]
MNGRTRGLVLIVLCALLLYAVGTCVSRTADVKPRGVVEAREGR